MKKQKVFWAGAMVVGLFLGIIMMTGQAMADDETVGQLLAQMALTDQQKTDVLAKAGLSATDPMSDANSGKVAQALVDLGIIANPTAAGNAVAAAANQVLHKPGQVSAGVSQTTSGQTVITISGTGIGGGGGGRTGSPS